MDEQIQEDGNERSGYEAGNGSGLRSSPPVEGGGVHGKERGSAQPEEDGRSAGDYVPGKDIAQDDGY